MIKCSLGVGLSDLELPSDFSCLLSKNSHAVVAEGESWRRGLSRQTLRGYRCSGCGSRTVGQKVPCPVAGGGAAEFGDQFGGY